MNQINLSKRKKLKRKKKKIKKTTTTRTTTWYRIESQKCLVPLYAPISPSNVIVWKNWNPVTLLPHWNLFLWHSKKRERELSSQQTLTMAFEIPHDLIKQVQIAVRKEANLSLYNQDDPSLPSLPSVQQTLAQQTPFPLSLSLSLSLIYFCPIFSFFLFFFFLLTICPNLIGQDKQIFVRHSHLFLPSSTLSLIKLLFFNYFFLKRGQK